MHHAMIRSHPFNLDQKISAAAIHDKTSLTLVFYEEFGIWEENQFGEAER